MKDQSGAGRSISAAFCITAFEIMPPGAHPASRRRPASNAATACGVTSGLYGSPALP